jgi:hypothetical protein
VAEDFPPEESPERDRENSALRLADAVFSKPFKMTELLSALDRILGRDPVSG